MASYATLKSAIQAVIKQNGTKDITGDILQQALLSMIDSLGAGYQFVGVATPSTNPGTPDQNVFYIAMEPGEYTNFGQISIEVSGITILKYNGTWVKDGTFGVKLNDVIGGADLYLNSAQILHIPDGGVLLSNTGSRQFDIISDKLVTGKSIRVSVPTTFPSGQQVDLYFLINDNWVVKGSFTQSFDESFVLTADVSRIRFDAHPNYSWEFTGIVQVLPELPVDFTPLGNGKTNISSYGKQTVVADGTIADMVNRLKDANVQIQTESGETDTSAYPQYNTQTINIPDGVYYNLECPNAVETYIIWSDLSYLSITPNSGWHKMEYPAGKTFLLLRFLAPAGTVMDVTVGTTTEYWINAVGSFSGAGRNLKIRALILGDSYSDNGGQWVGPMMQYFHPESSYISLAVSSASLKDHYADRETYPYTSRPVSTDNTGNHNTLSCQIEKLKRLMAGTDLDPGESQIYTDASQYPNVIIIAGGKNDYYDSDETVATYTQQLNKTVTNVYRKQRSTDTATLGDVTIKTPLEEINRLCFAGAYRYLVDELLALFPNAQIYFATVSPLGYRAGSNVSAISLKIAEQQRLCADIFTANVIDWYRDGQINSVVNYAQGDGTQENPYLWGECTLPNRDTNDQLHPNGRGGKKYGALSAKVIQNTFLGIDEF